jgi:hypothetical protein
LRPILTTTEADLTISLRGGFERDSGVERRRSWYVSPELDSRGRPEMMIETGDGGYWLTYDDAVTFLVDRAGARVSAHWSAPLSVADAAGYLGGSVLAFVLRLRGAVPLHASAIVVEDRAILFIGEPWAGKSTTVAAFSKIGCPVLADDIVRIDVDAGRVLAYPGHPKLHLWSDSATALFGTADDSEGAEYRKHALRLPASGLPLHTTPLPVGAIYLLGERLKNHSGMPSLQPVPTSRAVVALARHTYGGCFLDRSMRAREFEVLCRLADTAPVRELRFGDDLERLSASCEALADRHRHE